MATYNGSGLKRVGYRVKFPDGSTRRTNTRAQARKLAAERGHALTECRLLRIGRSRNGAPVDTPIDW